MAARGEAGPGGPRAQLSVGVGPTRRTPFTKPLAADRSTQWMYNTARGSSHTAVPKSRVLSVFLIRSGYENDILEKDGHAPRATPIQVGQVAGTLYTESSPLRTPAWVSFFTDAVDTSALGLRSASASALLVVPMQNRTFAVAFGYGRYLINPLAIEPTFGFRATLNAVATDKIRAIDRKTFEAISTHTREQASKDTSLADFGVNIERDIVRAVSGTPSDSSLGTRLHGMDGLAATVSLTLDDVPEYLQAYLAKSEEETYKQRYPWIDNILEVRDKARRTQLDAELVKLLREGDTAKIWLAVPELIDWSDIDGFSYTGSADISRDIHLRDYITIVGSKALSERAMRQQRVYGHRASGEAYFGTWPVYKCVHAEITVGDKTYLLNAGEWYRINEDFVATVDAAIARIPTNPLVVLPYQEGESEKEYNQRLAAAISGYCLDFELITYGGGKSRVEFCDVYHPSGHIIHVKRYGGSSVLSHLFAQGLVSATAFMSDHAFRHEVNKRLPPQAQITNPEERPNPADYEVAFVIASRSALALSSSLPFFSRVTLRNAYTQLSTYGLKTSLTKVLAA